MKEYKIRVYFRGVEETKKHIPEDTRYSAVYLLGCEDSSEVGYHIYHKDLLECVLFWVQYSKILLNVGHTPDSTSFWSVSTFEDYGGIDVRANRVHLCNYAIFLQKNVEHFAAANKFADVDEWAKISKIFCAGDFELALQICKSFVK